MKWNSKSDWGKITWSGRKNGIKFKIYDNSTRVGLSYYVMAEISKDEDIVLNSLWDRSYFNGLEEAKIWCENLTQKELIRLRDIKLLKNKYMEEC